MVRRRRHARSRGGGGTDAAMARGTARRC
jgi:hypothetical protein